LIRTEFLVTTGYQPNPASATVSIGRDFRKRHQLHYPQSTRDLLEFA
jgi:hypothetical protein